MAEDERAPVAWDDVHLHLVAMRGDYSAAVKTAVSAMDEAGTKLSIVLPPPQVPGQDHAPGDYQRFAKSLNAFPGRFAFLAGGSELNAMIHKLPAAREVDEATRKRFEKLAGELIKAGARGFGEMAVHHLSYSPTHPYECTQADHPLMLLLADLAARYDVPIDLHLDLVKEDLKTPEQIASRSTPPVLKENLEGFKRLLAHNPKARIVWAHAGSDPLGYWTPELSRELLRKYPNLYMSLRLTVGDKIRGVQAPVENGMPSSAAFSFNGAINPPWLELLKEFPDRFVIGTDQFIAADDQPNAPLFSRLAPLARKRTRQFLEQLPADLARAVGTENARRIYKLP